MINQHDTVFDYVIMCKNNKHLTIKAILENVFPNTKKPSRYRDLVIH